MAAQPHQPANLYAWQTESNGLGSVVLKIQGCDKQLHMDAEEARTLGNMLLQKAQDAQWQNAVQ
jgi:hypothetical protein